MRCCYNCRFLMHFHFHTCLEYWYENCWHLLGDGSFCSDQALFLTFSFFVFVPSFYWWAIFEGQHLDTKNFYLLPYSFGEKINHRHHLMSKISYFLIMLLLLRAFEKHQLFWWVLICLASHFFFYLLNLSSSIVKQGGFSLKN